MVNRRVAQPHRRERIRRTERQILGHPFDEPAGKIERALARAFLDVDLERVGDLVTEDVIGLAKPGGKRHDDARFEALGESAGAFTRRALAHIRLRELRVACGIEDDHLPVGECVVEQRGVPRIPALRHPRGLPRRLLFLRVVIDVEVVGAQRAEFEASVLDLVAPEVLGVR